MHVGRSVLGDAWVVRVGREDLGFDECGVLSAKGKDVNLVATRVGGARFEGRGRRGKGRARGRGKELEAWCVKSRVWTVDVASCFSRFRQHMVRKVGW